MTTLEEKLRTALPLLKEHGEVYLCALFEREDIPDKWDVILSSAWSDVDAPGSIRALSEVIVPGLPSSELTSLSRVIAIPSSEPAIRAITSVVSNTGGGTVNVNDFNFMGLYIKRALIFHAQSPKGTVSMDASRPEPLLSPK